MDNYFMKIEFAFVYLLIINGLSFLITLKYIRFNEHFNKDCNFLDDWIIILAVLLGEVGVLMALLIKKGQFNKKFMLPWIMVINALVIHFLVFIIFNGDQYWVNQIIRTLQAHRMAMLRYLIVINGITFGCFLYDKYAAMHHKLRMSNALLFALVFAMGSFGAAIAMGWLHHKVNKVYFKVTIPLVVGIQLILVSLLMIG